METRDTSKEARLTMEERNIDQQEGVKYRNVCRRLFQDDDDNDEDNNEDNNGQSADGKNDEGRINNGENDNFANQFLEEAKRNLENAKERWNFDFKNEVPLSGRYEWVKLDRDGNEISETSEQLRNEICGSHEEQSEEAKEVDTEERE